ncbi:endonuclease NucS domain-containing protein [Pectobacterium parmentieri]|uniref:endonuclease NucS domain-containing protein n=1 Tax=Pectobacterium parmentieri TaxID=1905730 RepID=UPI0018E12BB8|nr:endonuclease NucS domain-containing protein [Pectobacterium parmentieri]QQA77096.1 DUF91 domain-containing protein [Pectobacterium parmentieri]
MKIIKNEAEIRDFLAKNLDMIETGLMLQKKEQHLKNDNGASGFVDIFARDQKGRIVIIEIKKSDAAARQGLQELAKYAALVRAKSLIKSTEYRLIILSVEWHELLTPFSEFYHNTRYALKGGRISLGEDGFPEQIKWINPSPKQAERSFSRRHFIWEYNDIFKARTGAQAGTQYMRRIGLCNFIFAIITLTNRESGISHLVYFSQQEESAEFYLEIINRRFFGEDLEEFNDWLEGMTEPSDILGELADKVWESNEEDSLYDKMAAEGSQISHPEKAQYWLADDMVEDVEIIRSGLFVEADLSDRDLLAELRGMQGGSTYNIDIVASLASKPEVDALLIAADKVLFYNSVWRTNVRSIVAYALHKKAISLELKAFSNDDILKTLVWTPFAQGYLPYFIVKLSFADHEEAFGGVIEWNNHCPDWKGMVDTYFEGDVGNLMFHRHFGSIRSLNGEIMEFLGLNYALLHKDSLDNEEPPQPIIFQGLSFSQRKTPKKEYFGILSCQDFISNALNNEASYNFEFSSVLKSQIDQLPAD